MFFVQTGIVVVGLLVIGWFIFSCVTGFMVYFSSLTTDHGTFFRRKTSSKTGPAMDDHTSDPVIMKPLNEAKNRWNENRNSGVIETLSLVSRDGLNLKGYLWTVSGGKTTDRMEKLVFLVHGILDSAGGVAYLAEEYHNRGWTVFSVDMRAHGSSEGTKRTMGVREAEDIVEWIALLKKWFDIGEIYFHGVSMGGATVLLYSDRKNIPSVVKGIIADSSFAKYDETLAGIMNLVVKNRFLSRSFVMGASIASILYSGVRFGRMTPLKAASQTHIPYLLFHGGRDALVPFSLVEKMHLVAKKRGYESVLVEEAPHIGAYFYRSQEHFEKIEAFYRRNS